MALAEALDGVPEVEVAIWRFGSEVERLTTIAELRQAHLMGGTSTHLAWGEAGRWLNSGAAASKVVVLFTDGDPGDHAAVCHELQSFRQADIRLLVGSIDIGLERCAVLFPRASVFNVDPRDASSSLQVAMKQIRATG
jgi:hypothetical protein